MPFIPGMSRLEHMAAAITNGNIGAVRTLISNGVDVSQGTSDANGRAMFRRSNCYMTLLQHALLLRQFEIARLLVEAGANPNISGTDAQSPFFLVLSSNLNDAGTLSMLQLFGAAGAEFCEPSYWPLDDTSYATAYYVSFATDMFKVQTAAWIELVDGFSPVQMCVSAGNAAMLRRWIDNPCTVWNCVPSLPSLAVQPVMRTMVDSIMKPWSPSRHNLFHSAHRDTVRVIHEISKASARKFRRGYRLYATVPHEIWELILQLMGREGFPLRTQPSYNRDPNAIPLGC